MLEYTANPTVFAFLLEEDLMLLLFWNAPILFSANHYLEFHNEEDGIHYRKYGFLQMYADILSLLPLSDQKVVGGLNGISLSRNLHFLIYNFQLYNFR